MKGVEKRLVSGRPRDCRIVSGKVSEVYDNFDKRYLPIDEFLKLYNEKGERIKEDKKSEDQIPLSNTVTTSNIKLSTSETLGIDISVLDVPQINIEIDSKKEEDIEKDVEEDVDPFNWYIKKMYRK
jgi:hypothetical protein